MADLAALSDVAGSAGIFCDFDGTLSAIVRDPADAKLIPGAGRVLASLAGRFAVVAVISGRAVVDLSKRVLVPGVHLVGLHGSEDLRGGVLHVAPGAEAARARIEEAAAELRTALRGVRGAVLEHKGLALAVHFRRASDPDGAEALAGPVVREVASALGLAVVTGRMVLEVRPPDGGDKGSAVRALVAEYGLTGGLVAGDDAGDLPAFAALDGLAPAVRVAVAGEGSPPALADAADIVVGSPEEALGVLRRLLS